MKPSLNAVRLSALLLAACAPLGQAESTSAPKAGADQSTPSRAQYFSWINNTNEGATEEQTKANLAFFQWLHDEFGMTLDIYAFDAGFVDGKAFSAILDKSDRFKQQFPTASARSSATRKEWAPDWAIGAGQMASVTRRRRSSNALI
jgi:hypothetical protein